MFIQQPAINSVGQKKSHRREPEGILEKGDEEDNEANLIKNKFYTCVKLSNNRLLHLFNTPADVKTAQ